jgi:hypothetical protein
MILQKSDMLWTPLSIDIVVPLSLRDVVRARVSSADSHGCGRHSQHHIFNSITSSASASSLSGTLRPIALAVRSRDLSPVNPAHWKGQACRRTDVRLGSTADVTQSNHDGFGPIREERHSKIPSAMVSTATGVLLRFDIHPTLNDDRERERKSGGCLHQ